MQTIPFTYTIHMQYTEIFIAEKVKTISRCKIVIFLIFARTRLYEYLQANINLIYTFINLSFAKYVGMRGVKYKGEHKENAQYSVELRLSHQRVFLFLLLLRIDVSPCVFI